MTAIHYAAVITNELMRHQEGLEDRVRCLDAFLFPPSPFPIFLPTTATATPSHRPHPYFFREPLRSPTTLSRQSYPVFSLAQIL